MGCGSSQEAGPGALSEDEIRTVLTVELVVNSLSIIGSSFIIACWICFPSLRKFAFTLVIITVYVLFDTRNHSQLSCQLPLCLAGFVPLNKRCHGRVRCSAFARGRHMCRPHSLANYDTAPPEYLRLPPLPSLFLCCSRCFALCVMTICRWSDVFVPGIPRFYLWPLFRIPLPRSSCLNSQSLKPFSPCSLIRCCGQPASDIVCTAPSATMTSKCNASSTGELAKLPSLSLSSGCRSR